MATMLRETYDEWLARLSAEPFGQMWLAKLNFDFACLNLSPDIQKRLKLIIEHRISVEPPATPPLALLSSAILEGANDLSMKGARKPSVEESHSLIVNLPTFRTYYLRMDLEVTKLDEGSDELDKVWEHMRPDLDSRFFEGKIATDRAFFWCAPTRIFSTAVHLTPNAAATLLRNRLGLAHLRQGERLIRIDVPQEMLSDKKASAPTTLDSGVNPAFVPCKTNDGYGRTLNLLSFTRDVEEAIVEELEFDSNCSATKIGEVEDPAPVVEWSNIEPLLMAD